MTRQGRSTAFKLLMIALALVAIAAPRMIMTKIDEFRLAWLRAESSPVTPGVVVQKSTAIDKGDTLVTEETRVDGQLVKEETTTTNAQGQLVSKVERTFQNGRWVKQERKTFNAQGQVVLKVDFDPVTGQIVRFRLVNGVLTLVEE